MQPLRSTRLQRAALWMCGFGLWPDHVSCPDRRSLMGVARA